MELIQVIVVKINMWRTLTDDEKAKVDFVLDYCDAVDLTTPNLIGKIFQNIYRRQYG